MAVFMFEEESSCVSSGSARYKYEFAERYSGILVPCGGFCASVIEVIIFTVRSIKSRSDQSLRQTPGPLSSGICMLFQFSAARFLHGTNDIIICCINVIICSKVDRPDRQQDEPPGGNNMSDKKKNSKNTGADHNNDHAAFRIHLAARSARNMQTLTVRAGSGSSSRKGVMI